MHSVYNARRNGPVQWESIPLAGILKNGRAQFHFPVVAVVVHPHYFRQPSGLRVLRDHFLLPAFQELQPRTHQVHPLNLLSQLRHKCRQVSAHTAPDHSDPRIRQSIDYRLDYFNLPGKGKVSEITLFQVGHYQLFSLLPESLGKHSCFLGTGAGGESVAIHINGFHVRVPGFQSG
ncbi:hypothetical protein NITGR_780038 [Nitrospina gracilis 3/211]|uniref:Uncharacterized protein n=1 Tax=Nitrospina gracilis (strain 3/211) TaxID=1266370 RepID=M1Z204_NITG3|nr:hypothetical protein NITGR_780038 [Nitrospina gracilis 3/211]